MAPTTHHGGHKLRLRRAVCRRGLKHLAGAVTHDRHAHGGAACRVPALQEHRGGLWGRDAHPVKVSGALGKHLQVGESTQEQARQMWSAVCEAEGTA